MSVKKGENGIAAIYKGANGISKIFHGADLVYNKNRLPAEFQKVEYIESDGVGQYIDTGINANLIIPIAKMKLYFMDVNDYTYAGLFGVWGPNDTRFGIYYNGIGIGSHKNIHFNEYNMYEIEMNGKNGSAVVNNQNYTGFNIRNGFANKNILVMARNGDNIIEAQVKQRLYYCRIYDDTQIVRNFVPCYRKADNVIGLYDLVNDVFYTNAGTGTFTKGANVN